MECDANSPQKMIMDHKCCMNATSRTNLFYLLGTWWPPALALALAPAMLKKPRFIFFLLCHGCVIHSRNSRQVGRLLSYHGNAANIKCIFASKTKANATRTDWKENYWVDLIQDGNIQSTREIVKEVFLEFCIKNSLYFCIGVFLKIVETNLWRPKSFKSSGLGER